MALFLNKEEAGHKPRPPAMGQEAAADVSRSVTSRRRAAHPICFARLPNVLRAVDVAVLLPLGR